MEIHIPQPLGQHNAYLIYQNYPFSFTLKGHWPNCLNERKTSSCFFFLLLPFVYVSLFICQFSFPLLVFSFSFFCKNIAIFYTRPILFRNYTLHILRGHRSGKDVPQGSSGRANSVTDTISKLDINANVDSKSIATAENNLVSDIKECKCGMPLCICEAPAPSSDAPSQQVIILNIICIFSFLFAQFADS